MWVRRLDQRGTGGCQHADIVAGSMWGRESAGPDGHILAHLFALDQGMRVAGPNFLSASHVRT